MLQVAVLVECTVLGVVHAVLERSCCLHVMLMLSKLECGVQGVVWRSCWDCCPGAEGAAGYCPAAAVPCRCCQACCPSAEGVAGRAGCCLAAAVHVVRCCRVLLLSKCYPAAAGAAGTVQVAVQQLGSWCGEGRVLLPTCMSCLEWKWCCCPAALGRAESPFWFGPQAVFGLPSMCSCMGKLRRGLCLGFAEMGVSGCCCPRAALGKNCATIVTLFSLLPKKC